METSHLTTESLIAALTSGLRPRPMVQLPDWMDCHVILERGGKLFPWQTSLTPYLRDIMLDLSVDSPVEEVVVIKPSQVGLSEMAIGFGFYVLDVAPGDVLMARPDLEEAARFKQLRVDRIIKNSPHIRAMVREKKSRDAGNTKEQLITDGGSWTLVGSNSPAAVASLATPYVIIDERDRMALTVGSGTRAEGDIYLLLKARTITFRDSFPRRKILQFSSPGETSTSRIEPAYLQSDKRRFWVPCPECGNFIVHSMRRLYWPRNGDPMTARYRCQECDRLLDERDKPEMLARGEWRAEFPERSVHGYKLVGCDSPFLRWGEMAAERERTKGNPNERRVYVNTIEGESYDTLEESKVDVESLKLLATPIEFVDGRPVIPAGVGVLTAGTDTQPNRLETTLKGWGKGEEQWIVDHVINAGDASGRAVWDDLDEYARTLFPTVRGMSMGIAAMCVDTAGQNTIAAYNFVRGKSSRRIWGTVGRSGQGKRLWPRKPNRTNIGKVDLYTLGVDGAKSQLYARLRASIEQLQRGEPAGGPGFVHIAAHLCTDEVKPDGTREPSEFLRQLVAEVARTRLTKAGPRIEWELPPHTRNEALDCDVLAQAAFAGWQALRKSLNSYVARFNPEGVPILAPGTFGVFTRSEKVSTWAKTPETAQTVGPVLTRKPPPPPIEKRPRFF